MGLLLCDDVDSVNDAWDVTQDREKDIQPEVLADAHLEEHAKRWQQVREEDA
jgi:hypothetical protein